MSRLIDPGVGDISDRLSILALKLLFGEAAGKPVDHFKKEQTALLAKIRARTLNGAWFTAYTELAAVNAALWHCEDDLRACRAKAIPFTADTGEHLRDLHHAILLGFRIQELNDKRAAIIAAIDKDAGESVGEEKVNG